MRERARAGSPRGNQMSGARTGLERDAIDAMFSLVLRLVATGAEARDGRCDRYIRITQRRRDPVQPFRRMPCCVCPGGAPIGAPDRIGAAPAKNDAPPEVWFAAAIFESVVYLYHARGDGGGGDGGGGGGGSARVLVMAGTFKLLRRALRRPGRVPRGRVG